MDISLTKMAARPHEGTYDVNLPRTCIGVLHQMRTRMSLVGMSDLTDSIRAMGQQMAGLVVALNRAAALSYIRNINLMWGTKYRLKQFTPVFIEEYAAEFYLFMVAGHRRFKAVELAGLDLFYCRLHFESSFSEALLLQYHENVHEQVPPDEEARFITLFWREEKRKAPALTLAKFARSLGKKPEVVRRSIRFTSLPVRIQTLVLPSDEFKKGIAYALLCELARLQEAYAEKGKPYSETELMQFAYSLVAECKTAKKAAAWVTARINVLQGQTEMFELCPEDVSAGSRRTVSSLLEGTIRSGQQHLQVVARLHESGAIPKVASGAAVAAVERTLEVTSDLAPQIVEGLKGARGAGRARKAVLQVAGRKPA